jgi:hypothetical protein
MIRLMVSTLTILACFGCASTPPEFEGLQATTSAKSFILPNQVVSKQKVRLVEWEYGLAPGKYIAVQENQRGVLYQGPGRSVLIHHAHGYRISPGGVWVPRDAKELPSLYVYAHQDFLDFKDMASAVAVQKAQSDRSKTTEAPGSLLSSTLVQTQVPSHSQTVVGGGFGWRIC